MLYNQQQIQDIIDFADFVLYKLSEESQEKRLFANVDLYNREVAIIYDLNQALKWGIRHSEMLASAAFCGLAAYVLHKVSRFGYVRNLQKTLIIVSQPSSATRNTGATVTFSVSVLGTPPFMYQWYKNGSPISGATSNTYTITGLASGDAGTYYVVVSDTYGNIVQSVNAILTVNTPAVPLVAYCGWYDDDPYADLQVADNLTYQKSVNFNNGGNISADFRQAPAYKWLVLKFPATQSDFTVWSNSSFNFGVIPDQVFRAIFTTGSYKYIVSRTTVSFDPQQLTIFSR